MTEISLAGHFSPNDDGFLIYVKRKRQKERDLN